MGVSDRGGQPLPRLPALRPVVVGVDGSPASRAAATAAAQLAARRGVPLRLVRALTEPAPRPGGPPVPRTDRDAARAAARAELEAIAATLGLPPDDVATAVREGPAELVLQHESRSASLLVVGTHDAGAAGHEPDVSAAPVSVAEVLVRRSVCPVLVVRPAAARGLIVVGVTGAPGTAALLAATAAEATRRAAALLVLHGWSRPGVPPARVDEAEAVLCRGYLEPLRAEFPDLQVEVRVEHGAPEEYLVRAAAEAELLVVGRRRHADHVCTAGRVAAAAPTPVLVVPLEDAAVPGQDRRAVPGAAAPSPR